MRRHPEAGYLSDLGMLRRFVRNGSFGYREPDNVVFQTLTVPGGVLGFRQRAGEGSPRAVRPFPLRRGSYENLPQHPRQERLS